LKRFAAVVELVTTARHRLLPFIAGIEVRITSASSLCLFWVYCPVKGTLKDHGLLKKFVLCCFFL
jgi:hypothetical protein